MGGGRPLAIIFVYSHYPALFLANSILYFSPSLSFPLCRFGYVEYVERATVPKALALSGSTFMGQPIIVQVTQAEKNRVVNTRYSYFSFIFLLLFPFSPSPFLPLSTPLLVSSIFFFLSSPLFWCLFIVFINLFV